MRGGVQSTALTIMAAHGLVTPKPKAAIFADTGWERELTYQNIEVLRDYCEQYDLEVVTVSNGNIKDGELNGYSNIPGYINKSRKIKDGMYEKDKVGMLPRQCTDKYKRQPIRRYMREQGAHFKTPAILWIGISIDEAHRMKPNDLKYYTHRFPLIEQKMSRADCVEIFKKYDYPVPVKSSCVGCPFHSDRDWYLLDDKEFEDAQAVERELEVIYKDKPKQDDQLSLFPADATEYKTNAIYLHRSLKPLDKRNINPFEDDESMQGEECEGMCFL